MSNHYILRYASNDTPYLHSGFGGGAVSDPNIATRFESQLAAEKYIRDQGKSGVLKSTPLNGQDHE